MHGMCPRSYFVQILYSIERSFSYIASAVALVLCLSKFWLNWGNSGIPPYLAIWRIFGVLLRKYGGTRTLQRLNGHNVKSLVYGLHKRPFFVFLCLCISAAATATAIIKSVGGARAPFIARQLKLK